MSCNNRIINEQNEPLNYTCFNRAYSTNINKGFSHSNLSTTRGSVLENPLINSNGYTLWLEYVIDRDGDDDIYWLMWYDENGCPTMPMSAIFTRNDLANMISQLTNFIP
jgi:hypothetical protein